MIYIIENYIDDITPQSSESPDTAMAPTPGHDVAPSSEDVVMASIPDIAPNSLYFAALHGLGKYLEGSGLDTVVVETGIYSPAALRGIYTGKAFKRGVAYHLMNVLACSFLKLDVVVGEMPPDAPPEAV